jgi:hypothetical protein
MISIDYAPDGKTLSRFLRSDAFSRVLCGPFGSGKTTASAVEIFRRAVQQAPGPDKVRRTRWLAVRNTVPQLKSTTIPSWRSWFDERFGKFNYTPPVTHKMVLPLDDGTVADCEVIFIGLDGPDAESNLKGFEGTGIWYNEIGEISRGVVMFGAGRVGRYPSQKMGGCTWSGIIADSNPWDQDHWLHALYEAPPEGWEFFKQPGGLVKVDGQWQPNPEAENLKHLPLDYYTRQAAGQREDWIKIFLGGEFGFTMAGRPVFPEFVDSVHVAAEPIAPDPNLDLVLGIDAGLEPACTVLQQDARGRWLAIAELVASDFGAERFGRELNELLASWFPDWRPDKILAYADPAAGARSQVDERAYLDVLKEVTGVPIRLAPSNDIGLRLEAVRGSLGRLIDGQPGLIVSPACKELRKALSGGYHFRRVQVVGQEKFEDRPNKNRFSHVADSLQYALLGSGAGREMLGRKKREQRRVPQREPAFGFGPAAQARNY